MIITSAKDKKNLLCVLEGYRSVFLVGCGSCATACNTGGEKEVLEMQEFLEHNGKSVTGWIIPDETCQQMLCRKELRVNSRQVEDAACLLVLACGAGVQSIGSVIDDKPIFSALDSLFLGNVERIGKYAETCSMCGNCVLNKTGGICPVTRCAKGLLNGPCGGPVDGKCEVNPDNDCAWILIYKRLKACGRLDKLDDITLPADRQTREKPFHLDTKKRQ
ncbi:MAG: methylenetetrahydrofolate reductase C-terminal domain-containing protein [Candidatus Auribacterota bacterium]|jgi:ferredoxin|nr:methylenetetrahydrofolate reductase C-terminal domain-containing protein [Candidatus Auribacterota bacterium]